MQNLNSAFKKHASNSESLKYEPLAIPLHCLLELLSREGAHPKSHQEMP